MKVAIPAKQWFGNLHSGYRRESLGIVVEARRRMVAAIYCCLLESLEMVERWDFETYSIQCKEDAESLRQGLDGILESFAECKCDSLCIVVDRDQLELMRMAVVDTLRGLDGWEGELHARTGLFVADGEALVEQIAVIEAQLMSGEGA